MQKQAGVVHNTKPQQKNKNCYIPTVLQYYTIRYVLSKFDRYTSVSDMISLLGWPTLESRCNTLRTLMMHKIMNNLVDVSTNTILLPSTLQLWGHTEKLQQLACRVNVYTYSFFPQAIKLWNSLPQHLISSPDFHTFKERLYNLNSLLLLTYHTYTCTTIFIFESVH